MIGGPASVAAVEAGLDDDGPALARIVRESVASGIARSALLVRLSRLPPELVRPQHRRLAQAAVEPITLLDRGEIFTLASGDLVGIWRGDAGDVVTRVLATLAHLFADEDTVGIDLTSVVALPRHADRLLSLLADAGQPAQQEPEPQAGRPLDPPALLGLEQALASADVARFARRKSIAERHEDGGFRTRWEKRFLSIEELCATLAPDIAPYAEPWLFRRLARSLEQRMLALLSAPEELRDAGPLALTLTVGSLLSPAFLRFDAALPITLRGQVVIDLSPEDVLADPAGFMFARDFAHARGYRLLLRGLTVETLPLFPRVRLGVDLVGLRWSAGLGALDPTALVEEAASIVLTRAQSEAAFAWGEAAGIRLYQLPPGARTADFRPYVPLGRAPPSPLVRSRPAPPRIGATTDRGFPGGTLRGSGGGGAGRRAPA